MFKWVLNTLLNMDNAVQCRQAAKVYTAKNF